MQYMSGKKQAQKKEREKTEKNNDNRPKDPSVNPVCAQKWLTCFFVRCSSSGYSPRGGAATLAPKPRHALILTWCYVGQPCGSRIIMQWQAKRKSKRWMGERQAVGVPAARSARSACACRRPAECTFFGRFLVNRHQFPPAMGGSCCRDSHGAVQP